MHGQTVMLGKWQSGLDKVYKKINLNEKNAHTAGYGRFFLLFSHNFSVVSPENLKVLHLFLTEKDL